MKYYIILHTPKQTIIIKQLRFNTMDEARAFGNCYVRTLERFDITSNYEIMDGE